MVNSTFIQLCSRAWALRILACLERGCDARISPLAHQLSTGRTSVTASLNNLIELGFVKRSGGHGHPLRPAFELTNKGKFVAQWAVELDDVLTTEHWAIAARNWALPVMRLTCTIPRYGELRSELSPVTDRALSQTLKVLTNGNWVSRNVITAASPPEVSYSPCGIGEVLSSCLQQSYDL